MVRLRSGDLVLNGCTVLDDRLSTRMRLFRSSDDGQSRAERIPIWDQSRGIRMQGGCASLVRLSSGRLLYPMFGSDMLASDYRAATECLQAGCSFSDGGETWSDPWSSGAESPENTQVMAPFPDDTSLLLVYSAGRFDPQHHHGGERMPLAAAVSRDGGTTWRVVGTIVGGPHAFGGDSICFTASGNVLVAYDWHRIPWDRDTRTGGMRVAINDPAWVDEE